MKRRTFSIMLCSLAAAALSFAPACALADTAWPKKLVISVPASGNVMHMAVTAMAKTIEKHTPVERVIVQPIGGPASWLPKMEKGQVDLAMHAGPDTVELLQGLGVWKTETGAKPFLRTVIPGARALYGCITLPDKGITKYSDLKGRVVTMRQPGNPLFDRVGLTLLASAGLKESDLKAALTMINFREMTSDIVEGRVDAALSTGSGPFMMELETSGGANVYVEPSEQEAAYLMEHLPTGFFIGSLPAHAPYFNNTSAIGRAILYRNGIYARADMDPEVAYGIIKAVDENRSEWENISPIAADFGTIYEYAPPYHEGVVRYYREKGLWTGNVVTQHENLLKAIGAEK
ncbi:TAXI family TRAP transporter solute-binding subunit [uncultured Mailhella sp.]|uniref:TAXI family TRAP transporter solute-binding subunit n=1 Tax=uncultured Mailhella sp. TaxID=1981031 RepID=UPI0025CC41E2|nr:TAXI family TRAP transporter solute-binding subunit [uncultured Mailhella sp.]